MGTQKQETVAVLLSSLIWKEWLNGLDAGGGTIREVPTLPSPLLTLCISIWHLPPGLWTHPLLGPWADRLPTATAQWPAHPPAAWPNGPADLSAFLADPASPENSGLGLDLCLLLLSPPPPPSHPTPSRAPILRLIPELEALGSGLGLVGWHL